MLEDNPYGLLRYEGEPLPPLYSLDGGVYVMYLGTFSKILSPGIRLGWVVAPPPVLEKINLGKQAADLCTSTLSQLMVQAYFEQRPLARLRGLARPRSTARGATRCSTRSPSTSRRRPSGRGRRAASSSGPRCPTSSTPPTCSPARCARTWRSCPARRPSSTAAGAIAMRLNFSGSDEDAIREGIRRIGEVVNEQVALYGTLTGRAAAAERRRATARGGRAAVRQCRCRRRSATRSARGGS